MAERIHTRTGGLLLRMIVVLAAALVYVQGSDLAGWLAYLPITVAAAFASYLAWDFQRNYVEIDGEHLRIRIVSRSGILRELDLDIAKVDRCSYDGLRFELAMDGGTNTYRFNVMQLGDRAIRAIIDAVEAHERGRLRAEELT